MELILTTVKVEDDEEEEDRNNDDVITMAAPMAAPNWLDLMQPPEGSSGSSSWDSGVVLDTNTVVQMAEFQEVIDSLQKGIGDTLSLPPPPYTAATSSVNSNHNYHNYHNSSNGGLFHTPQMASTAVVPPEFLPTAVTPPSSPQPPPAAGGGHFLFHDSELEHFLLHPSSMLSSSRRYGAASYHAGGGIGDESALFSINSRLTCQSLPSLSSEQHEAAGAVSTIVERPTGQQNYALQLRWRWD